MDRQSLPTTPPPGDISHVTAKGKGCRQIRNEFADDRGFPDETDEHDNLLHNIDGSPVFQKLRHPSLPIDEIDPTFDFALHGARLRRQLDLSYLDNTLQTRIYALIRKYWSVF